MYVFLNKRNLLYYNPENRRYGPFSGYHLLMVFRLQYSPIIS